MSTVLIVEDDPAVAEALALLLDLHDIPSRVARTPAEALAAVAGGRIRLVIQDMNFRPGATSGADGAALFRDLRRADPGQPVLLMTAWTSLETAVALVREGAADYFGKPWDDTKLVASVRNLLRLRTLEDESARARNERAVSRADLAARHDLRGLVYESEAMHRLVSLAVKIAPADVPVLVTGPNGVGKERIAEIVQANSRRGGSPFVKVHAGALPHDLLESELFGAEAGAYTGAHRAREGRFEAADGGTLFLDEIGTLPPEGQVKLLRVLQSGEFERLGSSQTRSVDVRVVCATNADLAEQIRKGLFREDLYFRLNVVELAVPALKERPDDVLPLASALLASFAAPRKTPVLSPAAQRALLGHSWPGNVRELENRLRRALVVEGGEVLDPAALGFGDRAQPGPDPARPDAAERAALESVIVKHEGRVSQAAEELGLSRQALYRKMEKLGITLERRPRD
ncbi:MAG: sigma-54 dependent transcriptional regulator [Acidobacteriota bacterium]